MLVKSVRLFRVFTICVLVLTAGAAFAQTSTDFNVVGFDTGFLMMYRVDSGVVGTSQTFGARFAVSNNLDIGFLNVTGTGASMLLSLGYGIVERFGTTIYVGRTSGGVLAGGLGIDADIFERRFQNTINAVLKLKLAYMFNQTDGITAGNLGAGFFLGFGL